MTWEENNVCTECRGYNCNILLCEDCVKEKLKTQKEEIYNFAENWFEDKRKDNDLLRLNQDELVEWFLEQFKKRWLKNE